MSDSTLKRLLRPLDDATAVLVRGGAGVSALGVDDAIAVDRNGGLIGIDGFRFLLLQFMNAADREWPERTRSDAWLAPRLHWALRLSRREAADRAMWAFLANVEAPQYVRWRWETEGIVAANRWDGAFNKQALARLWWGAELFRNGTNYAPVEQLFANQDYPNSYIHRAFVRTRPLALGLLDALADHANRPPTSKQINDVARKVNLCTAAVSIESATGYHRDDARAYRAWVLSPPAGPFDFEPLPVGPADGGVDAVAMQPARSLGDDICEMAEIGGP